MLTEVVVLAVLVLIFLAQFAHTLFIAWSSTVLMHKTKRVFLWQFCFAHFLLSFSHGLILINDYVRFYVAPNFAAKILNSTHEFALFLQTLSLLLYALDQLFVLEQPETRFYGCVAPTMSVLSGLIAFVVAVGVHFFDLVALPLIMLSCLDCLAVFLLVCVRKACRKIAIHCCHQQQLQMSNWHEWTCCFAPAAGVVLAAKLLTLFAAWIGYLVDAFSGRAARFFFFTHPSPPFSYAKRYTGTGVHNKFQTLDVCVFFLPLIVYRRSQIVRRKSTFRPMSDSGDTSVEVLMQRNLAAPFGPNLVWHKIGHSRRQLSRTTI